MKPTPPYELPESLPPALQEVLSYWKKLRRGQATIPFSDDIKFIDLPRWERALFLLDASSNPQRFRFGVVGKDIVDANGHDVAGIFLDQLEPNPPFDLIHSQASAAAELRAPTCYIGKTYLRMMLPAWGDGHVSAILGIIQPSLTPR